MKKKDKILIISVAAILFITPLVLFWLVYPYVLEYANAHFIFPVYQNLMKNGVSITFAMNIRVLLKGFVFTVLLMVLWFPFTLCARELYLKKYCRYIGRHQD